MTSAESTQRDQFSHPYRWVIVIVMFLACFVGMYAQGQIAVFAYQIIPDLGLTSSQYYGLFGTYAPCCRFRNYWWSFSRPVWNKKCCYCRGNSLCTRYLVPLYGRELYYSFYSVHDVWLKCRPHES
jgi:hypothetical protein